MNKVNKNREEEEKKFKPEFDEYKASTEYKKMVEELKKKDEDDEFRNDFDPKGYDLFEKSVRFIIHLKSKFIIIVERSCHQSI